MTDHTTATELDATELNIITAAELDVRSRATKVARIFDLLAMVVLGVGAVAALVWVGAAIVTIAAGDDGFFALLAIVGLLVTAVGTVLAWAGVTLATVVAGYIADRS